MYSNNKLDQTLTVQLCDEAENPTAEANTRMTLSASSDLQLTNVNLQMKADKDGLVTFGKPLIVAPTGPHKLTIKAIMGRTTLVTCVNIYVYPDPNKLSSVEVDYKKPQQSLLVGEVFPGKIIFV